MTDECRSRNELSDALRHRADELPDDLVITRGLMRMAADRLATLEAAQSESVDITVPRDLWNEILDFITDRVDVKDGASGPIPNKAMHLCSRIAEEVNP